MIHENIELTGSFTVSGSFVLPSHPSSSAVYETGSLYHDSVDGILKVYTGTQWVVVGEQTTPSPPASTDIEYLVIAGGGGGSSYGGGGAGGYLSSSLASMSSGSTFTVTVGGGGNGSGNSYSGIGAAGTNSTIAGSTISTVTAVGGGYGGNNDTTAASDGGSGGGGSDGPTDASGGDGTAGQGNNGGDGSFSDPHYMGGGGGGAGSAGGNGVATGTRTGGPGGDGLASKITGQERFRAGGGGGVRYNTTGTTGAGGAGGGGNGGSWNATTSTLSSATAGTTNSGSGGGSGQSGGSGVAIFAYDSSSFNCAGGIVGDAGNGRKYNQFNESSTFKVGSTSDFQIVTSDLQLHLDAGNFASRGTSTWTDLSGNGNNGTVTGATLAGPYYTFNGSNEYISLAESSGASTVPHTVYGTFTGASETNWTLECWFKTSENDTDTWGTAIIGRDSSDLFGQLTVKNNLVHYLHASPGWGLVSSTSTVTDDTWHHVVLVNYSNATMDLWLDGVKEATGVDSTIYYSVSTRYFKLSHVGKGYLGDHTACDVAQIRLYSTDLSDAQVLQNYNATKTNFT